jgi:hypothetical protein
VSDKNGTSNISLLPALRRGIKKNTMTKKLLLLVLSLFLTGQHAFAFEGTYKLEIHHTGKKQKNPEPMTMKVSVKGDKMVSQPISGMSDKMKDMRMIVNRSDMTITTLMDMNGQKMGMKRKLEDKEVKEAEKIEFKKTGKTKTIQGYACEEYIGENDKSKIDMWISPELTKKFKGNLSPFTGHGIGGKQDENYFKNAPGFPLEMNVTDKKSEEISDIYIKDIKEGAVDESVFSTAGYQIMEKPMGK